jgi:hypothetical protein
VRWPQIRATLIAIAIVLALVDGLPLNAPDDTPAWERGFVDVLRHVQRVVMWPMKWVHPTLRITQRWALYQAPTADRMRLLIEGRRDGQWQILYRAGDSDHTEYADILEYGRIRGAWDITGAMTRQYRAFADWISARALVDHPELTAVRLRMEKVTLSSEGVTPLGQYAYIYVRERDAPP